MIGLAGSAISTGFAWLFIQAFDRVAYILLANSYAIFLAVSKLNIFGTEGGKELFSDITTKVYNLIGIVMVFIVSYQLLMFIINPDKNKDQVSAGTGKMIKGLLLSITMVIFCPLLFKYMYIFQNHVITENTIYSFIVDDTGGKQTKWNGKSLSISMFISMFHPIGTDYTTFYDEDGDLKSDCESDCEDDFEGDDEKTCEWYCEALEETEDEIDYAHSAVGTIATNDLIAKIDDGDMEYYWVVCTVIGVVCAYFFISYSFDLGVRAVKLGVLQILAPVPILLRPFEKAGGVFTKWGKELIKCYVEVFIRLATIFFIVALVRVLPGLIGSIFDGAGDDIAGASKAIAYVILVLGLMKFAKEAPDLFKVIFSGGGGWLSGLDLKPGVVRRIEDNTYAMKAGSAGAGALSGAIGAAMKAHSDATNTTEGETALSGEEVALRTFGAGIRGAVVGGVSGFKNSATTLGGFKDTQAAAVSAAQESEARAAEHLEEVAGARTDSLGQRALNVVSGDFTKFTEIAKKGFKDVRSDSKYFKETLQGKHAVSNQVKIDNLNLGVGDSKVLDSFLDSNSSWQALDNKIKTSREEMRTGKVMKDGTYTSAVNGLEYVYNGGPGGDGKWYQAGHVGQKNFEFEQMMKDKKNSTAQSIVNGFQDNNKDLIVSQLKAIDKHMKQSRLNDDEFIQIAKAVAKSTGKGDASDDLIAQIAKNIKNNGLSAELKITDDDGKYLTGPDGNKKMADAILGLKAAGGALKDISALEQASISAQQQAAANKKKEDNNNKK